jgi:hypothetical protein
MANPTRPSALARWLEPFAAGLWIFFWVWTLLLAVIWVFGIGDAEVAAWFHRHFPQPEGSRESPLQSVLGYLLVLADPLWISLAAANCYIGTASQYGLCAARRWYFAIFVGVLGVAMLSAWTGFPLGRITFTSRLGARFGIVPAATPMLWCAVIAGSREVARRLLARASHVRIALAGGLLAALTDWNFEPIAWKVRVFWLWYVGSLPSSAWPPLQNSLTWFIVTAAAIYLFRPGPPAPNRIEATRPLYFLIALNLLCLLTHAARAAGWQ